MKWSVLSGCSALLALACSGTNGAGGDRDDGWNGWPGVPVSVGGESAGAGWGYGGATATGGSGAIPTGGFGAGTATGGGTSIPSGGYGAGTATGGSTSIPSGGYGAVSAGGAEVGGSQAVGGSGGVDPNSCSHDVARCFEAAAACYEYSPWSECDQIVDVCSAMEMQCNTVKGSMGMGATPG